MNEWFNSVVEWSRVFGNYKETPELLIRINGIEIEKVTEIKFLGITIDNKLSWKSHIGHIQRKISKNIAIINKAKYVLNYKALYILYSSLILSYLTYGIEVWGNNYKSSLHSLVTLQKRAIRVIHKVGYQEHTNILFLQSNMLKFMDLVVFYTAQLMYKANWILLPANIQILFIKRDSCYNLRGYGHFKVPAFRTTKKSMCVSVCGARLWNNLRAQLKQCPFIYQFKSKYKQVILSKYRTEECP